MKKLTKQAVETLFFDEWVVEIDKESGKLTSVSFENRFQNGGRIYYFNQDKLEALLDMLETQSEVIEQYLNSPYKAQKGVLESCLKHTKLFIQKVRYENTNI